MQRITLNEITPALLANLTEPVIIVDSAGHRVGYFEPQPKPPYASATIPELSQEEHDRRVKPGGRPLAEFLAEIKL